MWPFRDRRREQLECEHDERVAAGFWYDLKRDVVSVFGTVFSSVVLRNFETASGSDECYRHDRDKDGRVIMTRTIGHRSEILRLRQLLGGRPSSPENLTEWRSWSEEVAASLGRSPESYAREAQLTDRAMVLSRALRQSAKDLADPESNRAGVEKQLRISGELFLVIDMIDRERAGARP